MKVHVLDADLHFPPVNVAGEHGLLAVGGDLSSARLLAAYEHGAFPWFMEEDPILWWAPPERAVLPVLELKVSKSMRNELNRKRYRITLDRAFEEVVRGCRHAPRDGEGTWITDDIVQAYVNLHDLGLAHSVEAWDGDNLVGGLYGVSLGRMFFGKACFRRPPTPPKWPSYTSCGGWSSKDWARGCQIMNPHLASLAPRCGPARISRPSSLTSFTQDQP